MKLDSTFMHFLLEHQLTHTKTLNFIVLMESIVNSAKSIRHFYNLAAIHDNLGETGEINIQGEEQMQLDELAHKLVMHGLEESRQVVEATSEEVDDPIRLNQDGRYFIYFDPLDGSSNVKHSLPIGFLFAIGKKNLDDEEDYKEDYHLRKGDEFIATGMFLIPAGIFIFSLKDSGAWRFLLSESNQYVRPERIYMPNEKNSWELSYNAANVTTFPKSIQGWIAENSPKYSFRYAGSLAVDFYRLLNNGGIFMYPPIVNHSNPKKNRPQGKLRLMYECAVVSFIAREAGGDGIDHDGCRVLEVVPEDRHQRSGLYVGSTELIKELSSII